MKRYFIETNGENQVAFVDENNKAYIFHEEAFDEPLTLEAAKNADYSNTDNCETALEIAYSVGNSDPEKFVYDWNDFLQNERCIYNNPNGITFTEF